VPKAALRLEQGVAHVAKIRKTRQLSPPSKTREPISVKFPNAAGVDIGSASHFVAVPPDRADQPVREFASFTADLKALVSWLEACGVDCVAMESTGVYWIPLYEMLDARGFNVMLVNARHVKNVPGRKSDVLDCQWLQQLMSYGLLRGAFRPPDQVCVLRGLWRHRTMLLRSQSRHVQQIQKALIQMNIHLTNVISDIMGVTGQRILRAIVAGERDGKVLAAMKHARIHATEAEIVKSLEGNWRQEHLFALKQGVAQFDFFGDQLAECDQEIEALLKSLHTQDGEPPKRVKISGKTRNAPKFDLRTQLFKVAGVDLTRIDGIDATTALTVISEVGTDLQSRFPTMKHFTSWLGLCPGTKKTGGKLVSGKTKPTKSRTAQALRMAASSLRNSKSALGAYYRRMCSRMDQAKAIVAAAHKLARLVYTMLTKGQEYTDQGIDYFDRLYQERVLKHLAKRADQFGMQLVPRPQAA
jgi:transposase